MYQPDWDQCTTFPTRLDKKDKLPCSMNSPPDAKNQSSFFRPEANLDQVRPKKIHPVRRTPWYEPEVETIR